MLDGITSIQLIIEAMGVRFPHAPYTGWLVLEKPTVSSPFVVSILSRYRSKDDHHAVNVDSREGGSVTHTAHQENALRDYMVKQLFSGK